MKIIFCGYRDWAFNIYNKLFNYFDGEIEFVLLSNKKSIKLELFESLKPDLVLFYGWSWIIDETIINNYFSVCLHPSKLPKYRGGSPIQNQLLKGEKESAVTLFQMTDKLDAGNILAQQTFPLTGYLDAIFKNIEEIGFKLSIQLIENVKNNTLKPVKQNEAEATFFKRRKPKDSEINEKDFAENEAEYFYNLVRGLQKPYPEAFINCKNNTKLYLQKVKV